jgi:hypothetical protein
MSRLQGTRRLSMKVWKRLGGLAILLAGLGAAVVWRVSVSEAVRIAREDYI